MQLTGKVVVVTGAARGIGREIARRFVRDGAKVVIADRDERGGAAAALELGGPELVIAMTLDVNDKAEFAALLAATIEIFGRIDILVHNADILSTPARDAFPLDTWRQLVAIHLDGAAVATRTVLRRRQRSGGEQIIYRGSVYSSGPDSPSNAPKSLEPPLVNRDDHPRPRDEDGVNGAGPAVVWPGLVQMSRLDAQCLSSVAAPEDLGETLVGPRPDAMNNTLFFISYGLDAQSGKPRVVGHSWFMQ